MLNNKAFTFRKFFMLVCFFTIIVGTNTVYQSKKYLNSVDIEIENVKATVQEKYIEEEKELYGTDLLNKKKSKYTYNIVLRYGDNVSIVQNQYLYDLYSADEEVEAQLVIYRNKETRELENTYVIPKTDENTEIKVIDN